MSGQMTNFAPLRSRLLVLRRQTLLLLTKRPEGENLDAGLLATVANVQITLAAVEEVIKADAREGAVAGDQAAPSRKPL